MKRLFIVFMLFIFANTATAISVISSHLDWQLCQPDSVFLSCASPDTLIRGEVDDIWEGITFDWCVDQPIIPMIALDAIIVFADGLSDSLLFLPPYSQWTDLTCGCLGGSGLPVILSPGTFTICADETVSITDANLSPTDFSLLGVYPNPFNPSTVISFELTATEKVSLLVADLSGRKIYQESKILSSGQQQFSFDGSDLPSGVYFFVLTAGDLSHTGKILLLK